MQTAVYEKEREARPQGNAEALRFARGRARVQEHLAFSRVEREGENVGRVRFLPIGAVYALRERIAADDEREFVAPAQNAARDFFVRELWRSAAYRLTNFNDRIFLTVHCFLFAISRWACLPRGGPVEAIRAGSRNRAGRVAAGPPRSCPLLRAACIPSGASRASTPPFS